MSKLNTDLLFNVAQLLKEPVGSTRRLEFDTPYLNLDHADKAADPDIDAREVSGTAKATRLNDGLLVQGDVAAEVRLQCSRCLDEFMLPVQGTLEEQYEPMIDIETGRPLAPGITAAEDPDKFHIDPNHMMDLTEPVRQALLVSLPMKPLCREDCQGLCPQCGTNWNDAECGCITESVDERWAGLREWTLRDLPRGEGQAN